MRIIFFTLLLLISRACQSQPVIFSPLQQRTAEATGADIYDTRTWSFFTGAPLRSTPLVSGMNVYAGNAKGDFVALDKKTGQLRWKYTTGEAIHSSAIAAGGKLFFSDNRQMVYALAEKDGKLLWKFSMDKKKPYPWRFDYYYSSPVVCDGKVFIGGDDGFFYALDAQSGKLLWKFSCRGIVRTTAAVYKNNLLFGDTEARFYAVDIKTGRSAWEFAITGDTLKNENFGFDRRAITSSAAISGNKLVFGARDGYLYCLDAGSGELLWKVDHHISWIISTVAIKDSVIVTGTSDGRFIQALSLATGREIWKCRTAQAMWGSPLIVNNIVYTGGFDGQLYCIDLLTGKRVSEYKTDAMMLSSPVWNDGCLYVGSDDGNLYAFNGHPDRRVNKDQLKRYVFYEPGINIYFRSGSDLRIKNYLGNNGFKTLNSDSLPDLLSNRSAEPAVIVFASDYFPQRVIQGGNASLLRRFLDRGGRIVLTGTIPSVYKIDEKTKQAVDFNTLLSDSLFALDYGHGDTRSFMGQYPCFATAKGKEIGLPDNWVSSLFIDASKVDVVLGKNENGQASAFVKNYPNGGQLIQLWMDPDKPERLDAIIKAAEWKL